MAPASSSASFLMSRPTEFTACKHKQTSIVGYVPKRITVDNKKKLMELF